MPTDPIVDALSALGWILAEADGQPRAARLLDATGLSPDALRAGAADPLLLAAVLGFLEAHEPDLIACAADLGLPPERLVAARAALAPPEDFDA